MEPIVNEPKQEKKRQEAWRNWKSFTVKIKPDQLPVLNQRLKLYGYETTTEMIRDFIVGKFPVITEDRQIQAFSGNLQANGLLTAVANPPIDQSFYKDTNLDDMLNYLLKIKRLQEHNAKSLVSYFRRYRDAFFGPDPSQISQLTSHKRMWIMQAVRNFGSYYYYKTNNPECKELIEKIISRFGLNVGLDIQHRVYIVDENFIEQKLKKLLAIQGDFGLIVRMGLYSGLREAELVYVHDMEVCANQGGCKCYKLHVINKQNGLSIVLINWFRAHKKCYFTILPTEIWKRFRDLPTFDLGNIEIAHSMTKKVAGVKFMDLRKIHYNVMCRVMEMNEADILVGRAKSVAAQHYAMYELDKMAEEYNQAWTKFNANT